MLCWNIFDLGAWHSEEDIGCEDWNFNLDCLLDYSRCCSLSGLVLFLRQTKTRRLARFRLWLLFDDDFLSAQIFELIFDLLVCLGCQFLDSILDGEQANVRERFQSYVIMQEAVPQKLEASFPELASSAVLQRILEAQLLINWVLLHIPGSFLLHLVLIRGILVSVVLRAVD